jgi:hypothetical protein
MAGNKSAPEDDGADVAVRFVTQQTAHKTDVAVKIQVKGIDYLPNGKLTLQVIIQAAKFT